MTRNRIASGVVAVCSVFVCACQEPPAATVQSLPSPPVDAGNPIVAVATADTGEAVDPAPAADPAASDAGTVEAKLRWKWTGVYTFRDCNLTPCTTYRVVVETCPGPCKVQVEVDEAAPKPKRRLEGVGRATSNHEQLAVHTADDAVIVTLEFLPGDHVALFFGTLESISKRSSIVAKR